jgi:phenylalanyl-tRNA synthetase beta chain
VDSLQLMGEAGPQFHPGQSATLRLGPKNVLARFGVLHPATRRPSTSMRRWRAEIYLDAIPAKKGGASGLPASMRRPHFRR